jgi:hypothetical protein
MARALLASIIGAAEVAPFLNYPWLKPRKLSLLSSGA